MWRSRSSPRGGRRGESRDKAPICRRRDDDAPSEPGADVLGVVGRHLQPVTPRIAEVDGEGPAMILRHEGADLLSLLAADGLAGDVRQEAKEPVAVHAEGDEVEAGRGP